MNYCKKLSVVIPCFNEEQTINETYARISALADKWTANGHIFIPPTLLERRNTQKPWKAFRKTQNTRLSPKKTEYCFTAAGQLKDKLIMKILVIRPDAIGDLVLTLPAIQTLKSNYPEANITALIRGYTLPVIENHPAVSNIIYAFDDFKKYGFDISINYFNQMADSFAAYKSGIPYRLGDSSRILTGWMNNHRVFRNWNDFTKHEVEFNLELLSPLKLEKIEQKVCVPTKNRALRSVSSLLHQNGIKDGNLLIGIHIGSSTSKSWSEKGFAETARWLIQEKNARIILLGGKKEIEKGDKISRLLLLPHLNLVGKIELSELVALISRLNYFLGMDTGATHIAASFGIPLVMLCLTKKAKPLRWGPWQTRHLVVVPDKICPKPCIPSACSDRFCIDNTSIKEVISAVNEVLNGRGAANRNDSLYHWAQKSLGIAIVYNDSNSDRAEKIAAFLQSGGYRYYLTKETGIRKLLNFIVENDTLIVHRIGGAAGLAPQVARQFTGFYLAGRSLLINDMGEQFENCQQLIDFYFERARKG